MKNSDITVIKDYIPSAKPIINDYSLSKYYYYMKSRNDIYIKKEILKEDPPWTDDVILRDNSFTCVKRQFDRTTKWLIDNIINNKDISYADRVWRTIIFRLYNKIETAEIIGLSDLDFWDRITESSEILDNTPRDPFGKAYKIIRLKYSYRDKYNGGWKSSVLCHINYLRDIQNGLVPRELDSKSPIDTIRYLEENIRGVGDFIAYQVYCDLCYINEFPMTTNDFVLAGPGCVTGLNMLVNDYNGLSYTQFLFWLRDNIDIIFKNLDPEYSVDKFFYYLPENMRYWDLQDIENSGCEFSKYMFLLQGSYRKPRKYTRGVK